jgi:ATP-binding cassette subfamily C protein LapB
LPPERPPLPSDEDIRRGAMAGLKEATDLSNCVLPLLEALNWRGDPRHVAEALPHFINNIDITSFRNIMATLHYESRPVRLRAGRVDPRLMPCLFLPDGGGAMVMLSRTQDTIQVFDGELDGHREIPASKQQGTVYFFSAVEAEDLVSAQQKVGWFRAITERFRSLFYQTLGITLILNLLALATPLFVMAVYDKVVATGSLPTLAYFAVGVALSPSAAT